jgi:hypothetical protein
VQRTEKREVSHDAILTAEAQDSQSPVDAEVAVIKLIMVDPDSAVLVSIAQWREFSLIEPAFAADDSIDIRKLSPVSHCGHAYRRSSKLGTPGSMVTSRILPRQVRHWISVV